MNGGHVGNGVMQGWEQGEHWQRGEQSQALPGLAHPACLGSWQAHSQQPGCVTSRAPPAPASATPLPQRCPGPGGV